MFRSQCRQSPLGSGVRWVASVQGRPAGAGHHVGVSCVFQRGTQGPQCCGGWGSFVVHVDGRLALTRNCVVHTVALAWLFSPPRPEAVGHKRHTVSCPSWPKQRRGQFPTSCVVALARLGSTGGRRCSLVRLPCIRPVPVGPSSRLWF